ncbi:sulfate transporter family protein [Xanthobacter sp. DSM 24535]|uniref:sulfate transporter family protein n=1 Tax=Roseixanthobacter psychrophilus TaxID=3119917 RepID=UPI00372A010F
MFAAAFTAFGQVFSPLLRGVLVKSVLLALGLLMVLGIAAFAAVERLAELPYPWLDTTLAIVTGLGLVFGVAYLMPAVSSLVAGLFVDDVAEKVERASYPDDPVGTPQPLATSLYYSARFFVLVLAVNIVALMLLLVPGVNLIAFFVANAYLLSREYFEMVAMRFSSPAQARALRQANATSIFIAGLLMTPLLMVPILNLIMPVFGTAFMVHLHKRLKVVPTHKLIEA